MSQLHPLRLMARTDGDITTIYHSFFLIEYLEREHDIRTVRRIPAWKQNIDIIEDGLKLYIIDCCAEARDTELSGIHVITSSDGSRFYAFFRCYGCRVFVAISSLPTISFTRNLLEQIVFQPMENLSYTLLALCETPILPAAGMRYDFLLARDCRVGIEFTPQEQPSDADLAVLVLNIMTPTMLVKAWEAIVLERKVLVVSSIDTVVSACCEFLRRIVLPMSIVNTFVPLLPAQLLESVEAPFPYLLGANTQLLRGIGATVDLSDTVVVDLDRREVIPSRGANSHAANSKAPALLLGQLMRDVNQILLEPLGAWFHRPFNGGTRNGPEHNPLTSQSVLSRGNRVLEVFVKANISLMTARACTIRALFRLPDVIVEADDAQLSGSRPSSRKSHRLTHASSEPLLRGAPGSNGDACLSDKGMHPSGFVNHASSLNPSLSSASFAARSSLTRKKEQAISSMGYHLTEGVHCGFMQLLRDDKHADDDEAVQHYIPVWLELDVCVLCVYEYADSMPLLYISNRDVDSVSPSPMEPEGHVFELALKDQSRYRFTATDTESRRLWIRVLEYVQKNVIPIENLSPTTAEVYGAAFASNAPVSPNESNGFSDASAHGNFRGRHPRNGSRTADLGAGASGAHGGGAAAESMGGAKSPSPPSLISSPLPATSVHSPLTSSAASTPAGNIASPTTAGSDVTSSSPSLLAPVPSAAANSKLDMPTAEPVESSDTSIAFVSNGSNNGSLDGGFVYESDTIAAANRYHNNTSIGLPSPLSRSGGGIFTDDGTGGTKGSNGGSLISEHAVEDALFRYYFNRTQMMSSLHAVLNCAEFESILRGKDFSVLSAKHKARRARSLGKRIHGPQAGASRTVSNKSGKDATAEDMFLVGSQFEDTFSKYLWRGGTVASVLELVADEVTMAQPPRQAEAIEGEGRGWGSIGGSGSDCEPEANGSASGRREDRAENTNCTLNKLNAQPQKWRVEIESSNSASYSPQNGHSPVVRQSSAGPEGEEVVVVTDVSSLVFAGVVPPVFSVSGAQQAGDVSPKSVPSSGLSSDAGSGSRRSRSTSGSSHTFVSRGSFSGSSLPSPPPPAGSPRTRAERHSFSEERSAKRKATAGAGAEKVRGPKAQSGSGNGKNGGGGPSSLTSSANTNKTANSSASASANASVSSYGGRSVSTSERAPEKGSKRSSILGGLFSRGVGMLSSSSASSESKTVAAQLSRDMQRELDDARRMRDREQREQFHALQSKLHSATASYMHCQAELSKHIVEDRVRAFSALQRGVQQLECPDCDGSAAGSTSPTPTPMLIEISIPEVLQQSAFPLQRYSTESAEPGDAIRNERESNSRSESMLLRGLENLSAEWHDFVWEALMSSTWEEHQRSASKSRNRSPSKASSTKRSSSVACAAAHSSDTSSSINAATAVVSVDGNISDSGSASSGEFLDGSGMSQAVSISPSTVGVGADDRRKQRSAAEGMTVQVGGVTKSAKQGEENIRAAARELQMDDGDGDVDRDGLSSTGADSDTFVLPAEQTSAINDHYFGSVTDMEREGDGEEVKEEKARGKGALRRRRGDGSSDEEVFSSGAEADGEAEQRGAAKGARPSDEQLIRNSLLKILKNQMARQASDPKHCLHAVYQSLAGNLYQSLGRPRRALRAYAAGRSIAQSQDVMRCVVDGLAEIALRSPLSIDDDEGEEEDEGREGGDGRGEGEDEVSDVGAESISRSRVSCSKSLGQGSGSSFGAGPEEAVRKRRSKRFLSQGSEISALTIAELQEGCVEEEDTEEDEAGDPLRCSARPRSADAEGDASGGMRGLERGSSRPGSVVAQHKRYSVRYRIPAVAPASALSSTQEFDAGDEAGRGEEDCEAGVGDAHGPGHTHSRQRAASTHRKYSVDSTGSMEWRLQLESPKELQFLKWCYRVSLVTGLQCYRLLTELLHKRLVAAVERLDGYGSGYDSGKRSLGARTNTLQMCMSMSSSMQRQQNNNFRSNSLTNVISGADFTWVEQDNAPFAGGAGGGGGAAGAPGGAASIYAHGGSSSSSSSVSSRAVSEVLNESVICIALGANSSPCELSTQLLSRLREILRAYVESPANAKAVKKSPSSGLIKLKIVPSVVADIASSSAFRAFELQCCQLQKVDLAGLSVSERLLFFCNVYNMIAVHAIIVKGSPGNNLLERSGFMRSAKYNISGMIFSLLDIEHGVLRNASTKPMVFGPLTISITFSDRDPRKVLILNEPRPNVSFCLFSACASSPALSVLRDPLAVDDELRKCARRFMHEHVKLDPVQRSVELPGLLRIYWTDFGGNRAKVLKMISHVSGSHFAAELKPYITSSSGTGAGAGSESGKPKVEFASIDWTPYFIL